MAEQVNFNLTESIKTNFFHLCENSKDFDQLVQNLIDMKVLITIPEEITKIGGGSDFVKFAELYRKMNQVLETPVACASFIDALKATNNQCIVDRLEQSPTKQENRVVVDNSKTTIITQNYYLPSTPGQAPMQEEKLLTQPQTLDAEGEIDLR